MSETRSFLKLWAPCIGMLLLSLLSYADRSVLLVLSPTILGDLHMSATQYGWAITAFSWSYCVANAVWGYWIDRKGVWITILVAVALWSVASGAHALMYGIGAMCLCRGVLGFGEGATFPAGLATVAETMPVEKRSFALGVSYSGGSLGAMLAPLMITPIAIRYGWRWTFVLTAVMGLCWVGLWVVMHRLGMYRAHVDSSTTEVTFVEDGNGTAEPVVVSGASSIVRSRWNRDLFGTVAMYGLGAAPLAFGLYAAPLYLHRVLNVSQRSLGHLLWIPPLGWETGYLVWGWIADGRRKRGMGKPGALFVAFAVAGFAITLAPLAARSAYPVAMTMLLFYVQMFLAGGVVVLSLSDGMSVQRKEHAGFLAGFAISSWAAITGALTPVLGKLFDAKMFVASFWLVACLPVVGVALWMILRKTSGKLQVISE